MGEVLEGENFAYNAPQFCNLSTANTEDDPRVEEYFNINHENVPQYEDISSDEETKQLYYTPLKLDPIAPKNPSILRKSLSMSNLLPTAEAIPIFRPISKDRLNLLAQPKPRMMQASFESSAELITKFHQKTPKRFRTASAHNIVKPNQLQLRSNSVDINEEGKGPLVALINKGMGLTIPHSPLLATRSRSRPTMYMPHDVREEQELEELKKLQIKAKPVPKTNYGPAVPIKIDKKPSTVIQPFNLTRIAPKKPLALPEAAPIEFHAKPVPKSIFQKDNNETKSKPLKAIHTKPMPFSFQSRQEEVLKKREQLLTKVIEEEKKKREFHAQPIPKNVYKSPIKNGLRGANSKENIGPNNGSSAKCNNTNLASITLFKNTTNSCDISFKAKPQILKKEPFVPKLQLRPLTAISAFNLNTERRVIEREAYEAKMRVKEEALAEIEYAKLQEDELKEKMETALLRKQMEIKANPIRHFKPFLPVIPKGVTIPQTPKFVQKMYSATSSK